MGIYVSPERVERDGRLVAFAGEAMTEDEARARGLIADEPKPEPKKQAARKPSAQKGSK